MEDAGKDTGNDVHSSSKSEIVGEVGKYERVVHGYFDGVGRAKYGLIPH